MQLVYLIAMSRLFTPRDFGYFIVEFSLISLLSTIGSAGFAQIVFSKKSESDDFIPSSLKLALKSGLALVSLGCLLVYPWFLLWQADMFWFGMFGPLIVLLLSPIFNLAASLIRANFSPLFAVFSQVGAFTVGYATATYLCFLTQSPVFLFAAQAISQAIVVLVYLFTARGDWGNRGNTLATQHGFSKNNFVARARQLAGISFVANNLFRWMTSVHIGASSLGQLNRSEAFTAGTLGLFQSAFTSTIGSQGRKGKKLHAQDEKYVAQLVATYALATLTGSLLLSTVIDPILVLVIGAQWQLAASLSQFLIIGWAGYSVISVISFVYETKADWMNALSLQLFSLFVALFTSIFLWATSDLLLAAAIFGYSNLILSVLVSKSLAKAVLPTLFGIKNLRQNFSLFGSLACLGAVLIADLFSTSISVFMLGLIILGLGFTAANFLRMTRKL